MSARIEEIRQENRCGDVSYRDIEWLCQIADAAQRVADLNETLGVGRRRREATRALDRVLQQTANGSFPRDAHVEPR